MYRSYASSMLVKELKTNIFDGRKWFFHDSTVMNFSDDDAIAYDDTLEPMERKWLPSQEVFYIMSHSRVE